MSHVRPAAPPNRCSQEQTVQGPQHASLNHHAASDARTSEPATLAPRVVLTAPLLMAIGATLVSRSESWSDGSLLAGALLLLTALALFTQRRASFIDRLSDATEADQRTQLQVLAAAEFDARLGSASARALGDAAMRRLPPPYLA